jgi:rod shape determining protein RodA
MLPPVLLALLFVAGARRSHLAAALVAGLLMFPAMIAIDEFLPRDISERIVKPYQVERLKAYLRRDHHSRLDEGYQLRQSIIAFGSGGITGKGYQEGTQNRLKLLPARHTDFIFAIIGEEWGLAGTGGVLSLYVALVLLCFRVAIRTREPFARLVATGVAVLFAAQGFENLGMTLGLTPITGIPLPFVSFGGSSLVTSYLAVGLVLTIASRPVRVVASQDLNPRDEEEVIYVVDDHPAGAIPFPEK